EIEAARPRKIILSSEEFCCLPQSEVARIAEHLAAADVQVVLYLRNQCDFMISLYKQAIKSTSRYRGTFREFLAERIHRCDDESLVECWASHFERQAIIVRSYDRIAATQGIERNFLQLAGLNIDDLTTTYPKPRNVSPSDDAARLLRSFNRIEPAV